MPVSWCGRRLTSLESETGARIVAVGRNGKATLGPGDLVGQEGDLLSVAVNFSSRTRLDEVLGGTRTSTVA